MENGGKRQRAADEVAGGEGGELEEELEEDLAAPSQQVQSQLFLPRPTSTALETFQGKAVDSRSERHAKLAQARREQEQRQQDARQEQELLEAKRRNVKQESAACRSDGMQVAEVIDLTGGLPPARVFAETDETKACPKCAHSVLINAGAVACGTALCMSCGAEFCWRCKKVRADGRHMRCHCS